MKIFPTLKTRIVYLSFYGNVTPSNILCDPFKVLLIKGFSKYAIINFHFYIVLFQHTFFYYVVGLSYYLDCNYVRSIVSTFSYSPLLCLLLFQRT